MSNFIIVGPWKLKVPEDIEIYSPDQRTAELIPHSQYGYRFKHDSTKEQHEHLLKLCRSPYKLA